MLDSIFFTPDACDGAQASCDVNEKSSSRISRTNALHLLAIACALACSGMLRKREEQNSGPSFWNGPLFCKIGNYIKG
jgi:hypothetical protein